MKTRSLALLTLLLASPAFAADKKVDDAVAKAGDQIAKGKPDDAVKTLQKLVSQMPGSVEAQLALSKVQERTGDVDGAGATLASAVQSATGPARADALAAQVEFSLRYGNGKDALARAQEAVQGEATPAALASLALAQARVGDYASALQTAERGVQAGATSAAAHEARGVALVGAGRAADADAAFRKALELDPKRTSARAGLANALVAENKATEAVAEARKATEADPKSGEAFATLGAALIAENSNNWSGAIAEAQQGAFLNPKSPVIQTIVGRLFEANNDLEQAAAAYRKAVEVDPGYAPALVALVKIQERKGDLDAALAGAKKVAADAPQSGEAQLQLGRILLRKNDFDAAAAALGKAAQLSPGSAEAHAYLGTAYQYVRKTPEATAEYKKAVELAPSNLDYRTTYGLLLGIAGQYEQGAAELKKVIASPGYKDEAAYVNLGWIYRNMTPAQTQEAVAAYKKALEIDPKSVQAALGLGWAYSYSKSYDESIAAFQKAMQLDPDTAGEANNGIAWSFFFKKDVAQAKAYMEKAQGTGRSDARLKTQIERFEQLAARGGAATEEALAEAETEREKERQQNAKLEGINNSLKSKNPGERAKAAQDLAALVGAGAVPTLVYQLSQDPEWDVRIAAAKALGSLGGAARSAIPQLNQALQAQSTVNPLAESKEELQGAMKEGDLKRAVRDALQKIQGK